MNPMQKYPHITESFARILNMFLFYVFMSNKFFSFFRNMFKSKTVKAVQCVPTSAYLSRFITYAPFFIFLGTLSLEQTPLNLGSL